MIGDYKTASNTAPTGWHLGNIYELHLLSLLSLIELRDTNANWIQLIRYISKIAGIDSLGTNGTTLRIFDNQGNGIMVDTGIFVPVGNSIVQRTILPDGTQESKENIFIADFSSVAGENFDLNDIFFPNNLCKKSVEAISKSGVYLTQKAWCAIRTTNYENIFGFWLQKANDTMRPYALVKYV